jgi:uncharacterized repeat protein (TIGR03803 family)
MASITILVTFNGNNGATPRDTLLVDANGDLFGTTAAGGSSNDGTVFELVKTGGIYASAPNTLVTFNGTNGTEPFAGLIADPNGDLFGTTTFSGSSTAGSVFEITDSEGVYAGTPTTLATFTTSDALLTAGLTTDASGDLFGTTRFGGASNDGTEFELAKTGSVYASTPTTIVTFNGSDGSNLYAGLTTDANGDLFGTTQSGGVNGYGTVFELAKTGGVYASTPTTIGTFNGVNGQLPSAQLIADAKGDLFGTTYLGGSSNDGTVFELVNTKGVYASTPITLVTFNGTNGSNPLSSLIMNANGDLFGTTTGGGASGNGTVFKLVDSAGVYAATPTTLVSFDGTTAADPSAGLIADANGDLFGTTTGGGGGTVFELTNTGFVTKPVPDDFTGDGQSDLLLQNTNGAIVIETQSNLAVTGGATLGNPGAAWHVVGSADFNGDGQRDILLQNDNGTVVDYLMSGTTVAAGYDLTNPGSSWHVRGTGDFNCDGKGDLVLQNDNGLIFVEYTNGSSVTGGVTISNPGPSWTVMGVADFNGDGQPDLLLENTNGAIVDFLMNGATPVAGYLLTTLPAGWSVAGTGNYNGDSDADIIVHNDNGTDVVFDTNGQSVIGSSAPIGDPGPAWTGVVAGAGYNGDGASDLLVENTSGSLVGFTLNTADTVTGAASLGTPGAGWSAIGNTPMQFIDGTGPSLAPLTAAVGADEFNLSSLGATGLHSINGFDPSMDMVALSSSTFANYAAVQPADQPYQGGTFIALPG